MVHCQFWKAKTKTKKMLGLVVYDVICQYYYFFTLGEDVNFAHPLPLEVLPALYSVKRR